MSGEQRWYLYCSKKKQKEVEKGFLGLSCDTLWAPNGYVSYLSENYFLYFYTYIQHPDKSKFQSFTSFFFTKQLIFLLPPTKKNWTPDIHHNSIFLCLRQEKIKGAWLLSEF